MPVNDDDDEESELSPLIAKPLGCDDETDDERDVGAVNIV